MRSHGKILVLLALLLSATLAFAAGTTEADSAGPEPVMMWVPAGGAQEDQEMVNQAAAEYAGERIGAYPELQFIGWGEWFEKKQLALQSGEYIDIVFTANWNDFPTEVARNAWMPLNDLIDEHAPTIYQTVGEFLNGPTVDGVIYAVPTVKDAASANQFMYNLEYVEKYDVPIDQIKSFEDLEPWLEMIRDNEEAVVPYLADGVSHLPIQVQGNMESVGLGRSFYRVAGEVKHVWNIDAVWDAAEKMREWYLADFFYPELEDIGNASPQDPYFANGNWFAYAAAGTPTMGNLMTASNGYPIVGGGTYQEPRIRDSAYNGGMMSIGTVSTKGPAAIKIHDLMNKDVYFNNLLNWGIEGEHYEFADREAGIIETYEDSGYRPAMGWAMQNQFLNYLTTNDPPDTWDQLRGWNESATPYETVGFIADQSNIRTQLAAIANVVEQYAPILHYGLENPDSVRSEFQAALRDAGVEEVEAEMTRQVNEFIANKDQ